MPVTDPGDYGDYQLPSINAIQELEHNLLLLQNAFQQARNQEARNQEAPSPMARSGTDPGVYGMFNNNQAPMLPQRSGTDVGNFNIQASWPCVGGLCAIPENQDLPQEATMLARRSGTYSDSGSHVEAPGLARRSKTEPSHNYQAPMLPQRSGTDPGGLNNFQAQMLRQRSGGYNNFQAPIPAQRSRTDPGGFDNFQ
ncbi:unnamed protein product, partial [Polarella glacialis]